MPNKENAGLRVKNTEDLLHYVLEWVDIHLLPGSVENIRGKTARYVRTWLAKFLSIKLDHGVNEYYYIWSQFKQQKPDVKILFLMCRIGLKKFRKASLLVKELDFVV